MIYYIGLGSNSGDRLQNLIKAKRWLSQYCEIQRKSSVYETAAWGKTDQNAFYNAVLRLQCFWRPFRLLRKLKIFEIQCGRTLSERWGPRIIDLDILLWDGHAINEPILTIPHPYLQERTFVLLPLAEIEPELVLTSGLNVKIHLMRHLKDQGIKKITENW